MKNINLFLKCDCHGEGIEFEYDEDSKQYYVAFWNQGFNANKKISLLKRIKFAWQLLTKGHLFTEMVILDDEKANLLADFIKNNHEHKKNIL